MFTVQRPSDPFLSPNLVDLNFAYQSPCWAAPWPAAVAQATERQVSGRLRPRLPSAEDRGECDGTVDAPSLCVNWCASQIDQALNPGCRLLIHRTSDLD